MVGWWVGSRGLVGGGRGLNGGVHFSNTTAVFPGPPPTSNPVMTTSTFAPIRKGYPQLAGKIAIIKDINTNILI